MFERPLDRFVLVRVPSMHACGYEDIPGVVTGFLDDGRINVGRWMQRPTHVQLVPLAYGAAPVCPDRPYGWRPDPLRSAHEF